MLPQKENARLINLKEPTRQKKENDLRISSWNVLTLYRVGALKMFVDVLRKYNRIIVALQEVRWAGIDIIQTNHYTTYYSCQEKNQHFGDRFIVDKKKQVTSSWVGTLLIIDSAY